MADGILSIGTSGLAAAYAGLQTAGHNIANVSTPGYKRQDTIQRTLVPQFSGAGFVGKGVDIVGVQRAYSEILTSNATLAESQSAASSSRSTYLTRLDSVFSSDVSGVGSAINDFFAGAQTWATRPGDPVARQEFLAKAGDFAGAIRNASARLNSISNDATREFGIQVQNVNGLAKQVATLNDRISVATASGQAPNDLLDQRDNLIREISKQVNVSEVNQHDGSVNLFIGNGQAFVVGNQAGQLVAATSKADPTKLALGLVTGGNYVEVGSDSALFGGGTISALMQVHNSDLADVKGRLGQLAVATGAAMNAQMRTGVDSLGRAGTDLFSYSAPVATASPTNVGNGTIQLTVTDASQVAASDYKLKYDGSNYNFTRISDGSVQSFATLPASLDGLSVVQTGGSIQAGDTFALQSVSNAADTISLALHDPSRLAAALPINATANIANSGTVSVGNLNVTSSANANLLQPVSITFTGPNTFDVSGTGTGNPTSVSYTSGGSISFNGWTVRLDGVPKAGDVVSIGQNLAPANDNRNALNISGFSTSSFVNGLTPAGAYSSLVGNIGIVASSAQREASTQSSIRDDAVGAEQSYSGVNLDEEAAKLLQYQQAYQASAKMLATAQKVFDSLLTLGN